MMKTLGMAVGSAMRASIWGAKKPIVEGPRVGVCAC